MECNHVIDRCDKSMIFKKYFMLCQFSRFEMIVFNALYSRGPFY